MKEKKYYSPEEALIIKRRGLWIAGFIFGLIGIVIIVNQTSYLFAFALFMYGFGARLCDRAFYIFPEYPTKIFFKKKKPTDGIRGK